MTRQVALVTGAAGGIGRATAQAFLVAGYAVALVDAKDTVHKTAQELRNDGGFTENEVLSFCTDITDEASVRELSVDIESKFGRLDSLALVAGIVQSAAGIAELEPHEWQKVIDVNLTGPYLMCHLLTPLLLRDGGGSITAVSSWWGRSGHALFAAYCASKAGLIVFIQSIAAELAPTIRANTVCPGNINTLMHQQALQTEAEQRGITFQQMKDIEWAKIPLLHAGEPSSIADSIVFLSSPAASYITGASLDVNGGVVFH